MNGVTDPRVKDAQQWNPEYGAEGPADPYRDVNEYTGGPNSRPYDKEARDPSADSWDTEFEVDDVAEHFFRDRSVSDEVFDGNPRHVDVSAYGDMIRGSER